MLFTFISNSQYYQRRYFKYFKNLTSVKIEHNSYLEDNYNFQNYDSPDEELANISKSLSVFKDLRKISLDFSKAHFNFSQEQKSNTKIPSSQSFLCEILKMLSQIPTLEAIEIKMLVMSMENKAQKLKAFTEKLTQLKYLKLDFNFLPQLKESGKIYTTLLPMTTLRHLSVNLNNYHTCYSDLIDFISSFKHLETFECNSRGLLFDQYNALFQAIQKFKSLKKLTIVQTIQFNTTFAYAIIFKALGVLKKLTSIRIDVGHNFDTRELDSFPQHLLKHPTLKEVDIAFQINPRNCEISEGFYANIHRLREKLQELKLTLRAFPSDAEKEILNIIIKDQLWRKNFDCKCISLQSLPWGQHYG